MTLNNRNPVFKVRPSFEAKYTDMVIVTIESEQETAPELLNDTTFSDIE